MKRFALITSLSFALLAPGVLADGRKAGSVGVFPLQRSGTSAVTIVSVTNTNTSPTDGETLVHYEYVNVQPNDNNAFLPDGCSIFNRTEVLTPADTLSVLTTCLR